MILSCNLYIESVKVVLNVLILDKVVLATK